MGEEFIKFDDIEMNDVDIIKIVLSNKVPFIKKSIKYFIGYKNEKKLGHCVKCLQK